MTDLLSWLALAAWTLILAAGWWKTKDASTHLYESQTPTKTHRSPE